MLQNIPNQHMLDFSTGKCKYRKTKYVWLHKAAEIHQVQSSYNGSESHLHPDPSHSPGYSEDTQLVTWHKRRTGFRHTVCSRSVFLDVWSTVHLTGGGRATYGGWLTWLVSALTDRSARECSGTALSDLKGVNTVWEISRSTGDGLGQSVWSLTRAEEQSCDV